MSRSILLRRLRLGLLIVGGLIFMIVIVDPQLLWPLNPTEIRAIERLEAPSWAHPLGTDEAGSDLLARVLAAARLELGISMGSVVLATLVAIPTGLVAGFRGGLVDEGFSMVSNAVFAFPAVLLAVLVVASFGPSLQTLVLVLGAVFVPHFFQLVRDQSMAIRERGFVVAARLNGASKTRVIARHVLPNISGPLLVMIPQMLGMAILIEAGLSYLGLGVQPPAVTWGSLLLSSKDYYTLAPWYAVTPGAVITLVAGSLMFMGDAAARRLDPRLQSARRDAMVAGS